MNFNFSCNFLLLDPHLDPDPYRGRCGSRIRICIKNNADPQHWNPRCVLPILIILCCQFLDIDEKLDKRDLYMVKISDAGAGDEYGIEDIPSLVYFEDGVPEIFTGRSCEVGVL